MWVYMHMRMCACRGSWFTCSSALFTAGRGVFDSVSPDTQLGQGILSLPSKAGVACLPYTTFTWVLGNQSQVLLFCARAEPSSQR